MGSEPLFKSDVDPMLCPRCGEPMVPTKERGASWACRRCVLLVIPMGRANGN